MGLEVGTYISDLDETNPDGATDQKSEGDDHFRLIKATIKNSFPNISGAMNASHTELNILVGATLSTVELNYVVGVTSAIQTQLDSKHTAGGTDIPVTDGGTGASTAAGARTNLGLGALSELDTVAAGQIDTNSVNHAEISFDSATASFSAGVGATAIPEGFHWLYNAADGANLAVEVNVTGTFVPIVGGAIDTPTFVYSDGTNMRINNSAGSSKTVSYRRLG